MKECSRFTVWVIASRNFPEKVVDNKFYEEIEDAQKRCNELNEKTKSYKVFRWELKSYEEKSKVINTP